MGVSSHSGIPWGSVRVSSHSDIPQGECGGKFSDIVTSYSTMVLPKQFINFKLIAI